MHDDPPAIEAIRIVLSQFQEAYTRRDPAGWKEFEQLLADEDLEVIGTNGSRPGVEEWYLGRQAARELFIGDWQSWGDLRLDVPSARIRVEGTAAWLSAHGTVSMTIPAEENYADFLAFLKKYLDTDELSAEEKLLYILRGGTNTLYNLRIGEKFIWPLRFTAVLTLRNGRWIFQQMQFSFPTIYFPDVRLRG